MFSLAAKVLRLNCSENSGSNKCQTVCLGGCGGVDALLRVHKFIHEANGSKSVWQCQRQIGSSSHWVNFRWSHDSFWPPNGLYRGKRNVKFHPRIQFGMYSLLLELWRVL